jgi:biopolymer transport protein ExbB/TolQ
MSYFQWTIFFSSIIEIILLVLVLFFFLRLRKSEALLAELQKKQHEFVEKLSFNAQLEQELVASFNQRQKELILLEENLETRAKELSKLVKEAEKFTKSPLFLKQIIIAGYRSGQSIEELARTTGLTKDEIELIVDSDK